MHAPLRVGFDLDGVLLYNPGRVLRPLITLAKGIFEKNQKTLFHVPHNSLEREISRYLHWSSMFVADGYDEIKELIMNKKIEAYIVTARYSFLKNDFAQWKKKLDADTYFLECFSNEQNEQPHLFKERTIKELGLDVFVEDNWDIVKHLHEQFECVENAPKIFWIYNLLDARISYDYKFPRLKSAVEKLQRMV